MMSDSKALTRINIVDLYMQEINKIPTLSADRERELAIRYQEEKDGKAAHQLVLANLRFVVKIAHEFNRYGAKLADLIQEGNIGLMHAVNKYNPFRGYRLISYAVWWIKAYMRQFILHTWSLVKLGTTAAQKKLFFKLNEARNRVDLQEPELTGDDRIGRLAEILEVRGVDVLEMELRMAGRDFSLDVQLNDEGDTATHVDFLSDPAPTQEDQLMEKEKRFLLKGEVQKAMGELSERERYIVRKRLMADSPKTLKQIGDHFGVSRERARQIENTAKKKIGQHLMDADIA